MPDTGRHRRCACNGPGIAVMAWVVACGGDDVAGNDDTSGDAASSSETATTPTTVADSTSDSTADATTSTDSGSTTATSATETGSTEAGSTEAGSTGTGSTETGSTGNDSGSSDGSTTGGLDCALVCGAGELCDPEHAGTDDDCDGEVDEDCPCTPGLEQPCFRGDPSYLGDPACATGVQSCVDETWGACTGGAHAIDNCFAANPTCQGLTTHPMVPVSLADGLGNFGDDAITQVWSIACPAGEATCPAATGDAFAPLVAGEHTVTYTKTTANGGDQCDFAVQARKAGLHVELEWEHDLGGTGVDLDLHVHRPDDTNPWAFSGSADDCGWATCTTVSFTTGDPNALEWFDGAAPPDPVDWWLFPIASDNDCYYAPRGDGLVWSTQGMGCHNPRLLTDIISCDPAILDPDDNLFCHAERIDIDFPGVDSWYRIAVHYFNEAGRAYDVHPRVRIWCEDMPAAALGPAGYYTPEAPVTFTPADGGTSVWMVADVAVTLDDCDVPRCVVAPLYGDADTRTPLLGTADGFEAAFGPAYPPPP